MYFVFGSNEAGVHGSGAARTAFKQYAAQMGKGFGPHGHSYAIPTKDWRIKTLPLETIRVYVDAFIRFAKHERDIQFKVTRIGCGLAGLKDEDIAPMFLNASSNCHFDLAWEPYLGALVNYWGSYE